MITNIKLTQYSHGAGCGCKISPQVLKKILSTQERSYFPQLIVGNDNNDDAAVYDLGNNQVIISTADFFMPIVDDPFDFGAIAAVNAISDIYAMAAAPLMAIAILGWPIAKIDPAIAGVVLDGARDICKKAGIPLAGGHSIDTPEPIFGLAVTGFAKKDEILTNGGATEDCDIFITKPLGVGIFTTAQKQNILEGRDFQAVTKSMLTLNSFGQNLSKIKSVKALTDVTGFGLLGHLIEMCEASGLSAEVNYKDVPVFKNIEKYIEKKTIPGGTNRNYLSFRKKISHISEIQKVVLCDPQTSGGLLIAVEKNDQEFLNYSKNSGINAQKIGLFFKSGISKIQVK